MENNRLLTHSINHPAYLMHWEPKLLLRNNNLRINMTRMTTHNVYIRFVKSSQSTVNINFIYMGLIIMVSLIGS